MVSTVSTLMVDMMDMYGGLQQWVRCVAAVMRVADERGLGASTLQKI